MHVCECTRVSVDPVCGSKFSYMEWSAWQMPAPGQYGSCSLDGPSGGKFNTSITKSDIDWAMLRASKVRHCRNYVFQ